MAAPVHVPDAILVLGMHRSGTSATAGALARMGMHLGERLVPGASDNPDGYFEHADVVLTNETLLDAMDRSWDDVRALPDGWLHTVAAGEAQEAIRVHILPTLQARRPWAVKDPRMCRLLPLWLRVLAEEGVRAGCLLVVRHPDEVAASLGARDGMPATMSNLLWLRHLLEAADASRQLLRTALSYERLLAEPTLVLGQAASRLGLALDPDPEGVRAFINARSRHHRAGANAQACDEWQALARETYALFAGTDEPWDALDAIRARFDALATRHSEWIAVLGALSRTAAVRRDSLRRNSLQVESRANILQQTLDSVNASSLERLAQLEALGTQLDVTQRAQAMAERDALSRLDELQALTTQLKATEAAQASAERDALSRLGELQALTTQLKATEAAQASAERDALSRLDALQALTAQLMATEAAQASAERDASSRRDEVEALTMQLKTAEAALAVSSTLAGDRLDEIGTLGEACHALQAALESAQQRIRQLESDLQTTLLALQATTDHRDHLVVELAEIHGSFGWRWLTRGRALQQRMTRKPR